MPFLHRSREKGRLELGKVDSETDTDEHGCKRPYHYIAYKCASDSACPS